MDCWLNDSLNSETNSIKRIGGFKPQQNNEQNTQHNGNLNFASSSSTTTSRRRKCHHNNDNQFKINRSLKCYECDGFGHYQSKCATYLKRMKKGFYITLSDDDSSPDSDCVKNLEKFLRSRSEEEAKKSNFI